MPLPDPARAADLWRQAQRLVPEALDRPPAERTAFLDAACAGDDALRAELDALLDAHGQAEGFLDPLGAAQAAALVSDPPPAGETVGPYRIEREVGRGGMGVVYLAHDTRLDRRVALKFVPPHLSADARARRRLGAEARAAAALDHPCIAAVHDFGETADGRLYIAMAYADGETLRDRLAAGPLSVAEAVAVARQLAEGLGAAHARGIVHRDVKPSNVIVAPDGAVKLVDFGIARAAGADLTRDGATPGTVAYMSPEQTRGEPADARTDLWSLGVVLYEMLTGARPFRGETDATLIHAIRHDAPAPVGTRQPGVPAAVAHLVARCLDKDPAARIASADAVRAALAEAPPDGPPTAEAVPARLRVAVLPLASYSADPDDAYFADGMTDELIAQLSRLGAVRVIARTSAAAYRGTDKSAAEIGRELGVGTLLEGSVRRTERRVRITARLVDVATEEHVWAEAFDAARDDVLAVQHTIAARIAQALGLAPPADARPSATRRAPLPEAYDAYLKGRHLLTTWAPGPLQAARDHFQRAIDLDPTFARAWAGLADAWVVFGYLALFPPADTYTRGRAAAERALALDDGLAEAHTALGSLLVDYDLDWDGAEAHFRRALDLDPSYAFAHQYYAEWLRDQGRFEDALGAVHRAQALDPLSPYAVLIEGIVLWFARRYDDALATLQRLVRAHGAYPPAHLFRSLILLDLNDDEAALAEADLADPDRTFPDALSARARALARLGRRDQAEAVLAEMDALAQRGYVSPFLRAMVHLDLGERDRVLPLLHQARDERSWFMRLLKVAPLLDPLRGDPGFQALLEEVGLAD